MLKLKQYDLVRVISFDDEDMIGAEGVIESICHGNFYHIIFIGKKHNELSKKVGGHLFTDDNLEVI